MARIVEINIAADHKRKLKFRYHGSALRSGNLIVMEGLRRWVFRCEGQGGNYTISGGDWEKFAKSNGNAMITLDKEDGEDFYRIQVR